MLIVQSLAVQRADFRLEHFLGDGCDLIGHYPAGFGQTIIWIRLNSDSCRNVGRVKACQQAKNDRLKLNEFVRLDNDDGTRLSCIAIVSE